MTRARKTFRVGREVWLRDGSRWSHGRVSAINTTAIVVTLDGGIAVAVHEPIAFKCLRVSRPKEQS